METEFLNEDLTDRDKTVCFSGHRPEKLPDYGVDLSLVIRTIKSILYKEILDCIEHGYNIFITGLARGVDLWAGEIVLELQAKGYDAKLVAAVPYRGFGSNYKDMDKFILGNILLKADETVYLGESYSKGCLQRRNEYMINRSCRLLAVVSEYRSGTGQTIRYAEKQGLDARILNAGNLDTEIGNLICEEMYMH